MEEGATEGAGDLDGERLSNVWDRFPQRNGASAREAISGAAFFATFNW